MNTSKSWRKHLACNKPSMRVLDWNRKHRKSYNGIQRRMMRDYLATYKMED